MAAAAAAFDHRDFAQRRRGYRGGIGRGAFPADAGQAVTNLLEPMDFVRAL